MKRYGPRFWTLISLLALIGSLSGMGSLLLGLFLPSDLDAQTTLIKTGLNVSGLMILGFSTMLLVTGWRGLKKKPSLSFHTPRGWIAPLVLWIGLIVLIFLLPGLQQMPILLAAIHLLLIALPAFFLLDLTALAAGAFRDDPLEGREIIIALTGGALSTAFAFTLEIIALVVSIILVIVLTVPLTGGAAELTRLADELQRLSQQPPSFMSETLLTGLLSSPVVLGVLVLTLAVATPLIEELGKAALIAILGYWERFDLRRAFLWGVLCGLGFALIEGTLNGLMSAVGPAAGWAGAVGVRALATAMHALTSGLVGLGWGYVWQQQRRWMLPLLYLGAVFFHGLWNLSTIGLVAGSLQMVGETVSVAGGLTVLLGSGTLLLLALAAPAGLIGTALWLRRRTHRANENVSMQASKMSIDT